MAMRDAREGGPDAIRRLMRQTEDDRIEELAFRFLARTAPDQLDGEETARWQAHRRDRMTAPGGSNVTRVDESIAAIETARAGDADQRVLDEVEAWTRGLASASGLELPLSS
tara:strand:- start:402 stop:737 length:336 start_codon:yes stop_codon:yes gene_type:complete